jgi:hypothetical protein
MLVTPCRPYHGRTHDLKIIAMPDHKSVFKVYFISILGRDQPEAFEWEHAPFAPVQFEATFRSGPHEGIGFIIAFPHITKVFRFSPGAETVLDVTEFQTAGMRPKDCSRGDGSHEFACYAESMIAADEHEAWARAATVQDYLEFRSARLDFPVTAQTKLADYWR